MRLILIAASVFSFMNVFGQTKKELKGSMIYLLGPDTTMAGSYQLKDDNFEVTVLSRPNVTITKMKGSFFPNGELKTAEGYAYKPLPNGDTQLITRYSLFVRNDTTFITANNNLQKFPAKGMLSNAMGTPFRYMLAFWSYYGPQKTGDSVVSNHLTFGTGRRLVLKRTAPDQIIAGSNVMGYHKFQLDKDGNIILIDAIGSTWNTLAKVVPALDLDKMTAAFLNAEKAGSGIAVINQFDSVKTQIGDAHLKVYYSRPQVRGRTIFGNVLPWGRFWRTGANAATKFVTDKDLYFGDKKLAAGEYSVWTIPSQKEWTIMFNSKASVWGTEYDPSFDVLKLPMRADLQPNTTELLTIGIETDAKNNGSLFVQWEKIKASIAFTAGN